MNSMKEQPTAQEQLFIDEYLIDLNQTQAAIRAGYSPASAHVTACRLMKRKRVKDVIDKAMAARSRRTGITADRILREYARIGFVDPLKVIDPYSGKVLSDASDDDTAAILSVKVKTIPTEDGDIVEREVRFHDKNRALEMAGKHLGMFTDKVNHKHEVTGKDGGPIETKAQVMIYLPDNGRGDKRD